MEGSEPLLNESAWLAARRSPVAELPRVQVSDARKHTVRGLLKATARKEIGMTVPLVLILPITVALATTHTGGCTG